MNTLLRPRVQDTLERIIKAARADSHVLEPLRGLRWQPKLARNQKKGKINSLMKPEALGQLHEILNARNACILHLHSSGGRRGTTSAHVAVGVSDREGTRKNCPASRLQSGRIHTAGLPRTDGSLGGQRSGYQR
ncbi:hypothetical protein NDU88_005468 [Pleurodeles waltl]|uniref:Uncharacterized protein n=1 Tax=Pleurodeles waltl TaxID=8319 RepID=A0AAV7WB39_PLEWA|nr:hypothetical protein NDU88_005468 [Pleurodeles waltl]